jgi:hypothetical protein
MKGQEMKGFLLSLMLCLIVFSPLVHATDDDSAVKSVEMIIWEYQNWETNGGYKRLTLWNDGRSAVEVVPSARIPAGPTNLLPKKGWTAVREEHQIRFVRKNIYPPEVAKAKLRQAVEAGILHLTTFRPSYLDGSGTRVVVQINGKQKETLIPMFMDKDKKTENYRRFTAVSKILNGYNADAFKMINK